MNFLPKLIVNFTKAMLNIRLFKLLLWSVIVLCGVIVYLTFLNDHSDTQSITINENSFPVILWWTNGFPGSMGIRTCPNNIKCNIFSIRSSKEQNVDAYLFYASNIKFDDLPLPRRPEETIWGLYHEESPRNVEELSHEEALRIFNYSSTFSRYSDVPFPLQFSGTVDGITSSKYFVPTEIKNNYKDLAPILYLQTDCETATERDEYVKEIMEYIQVDSYGECLKNKEMPVKFTKDYLEHLDDDDFLKFVARYKFVIALENGICDDYVTEKFWRAIKVGTVPIYFGSPSIRDWLPNMKSAILLEDYRSPKIMSEYIKKLLANDYLYEEHLEHKTKKIVTNFRLIDELKTRTYQTDALMVVEKFECFICKKIYDRKMGVSTISFVDKRHYDCPKPISALNQMVNPNNNWVYSWEMAGKKAKDIEKTVLGIN